MTKEDKEALLAKLDELQAGNAENCRKGLLHPLSMAARDGQLFALRDWINERFQDPDSDLGDEIKHSFTHHKPDESLVEAVKHQMEDDGNVDDFVRRGIDDIVIQYSELGSQWKEKQMMKGAFEAVVKTLVGSDRLVFIPRDEYALGEKVKVIVIKAEREENVSR